MKKIISILVALLMLLSSVSALAAVEVNPASPSMGYMNTMAGKADTSGNTIVSGSPAGSSGANVGFNKDHPVNFAFVGEKLTVSRPAEIDGKPNGKLGLTYLNFVPSSSKVGITDDKFAFGFDVMFSNITSNGGDSVLTVGPGTYDTIFDDSAQEKIDSGEWVVGDGEFTNEIGTKYFFSNYAFLAGKKNATKLTKLNNKDVTVPDSVATKSSWLRFKKSGDDLAFVTKKDSNGLILGENGQPAVFFGTAKLEQDAFYTLKVYVDQTTKKYDAVIIDATGNVMQTGVDGTLKNVFNNLSKAELQLQGKLNYEASVTYDNIFCDNLEFAIEVPAKVSPNEDGTISFNAAIPDDVVAPALYINDTFVENISIVPGKTDYNFVSALPAGTTLGDAKLEIRGTRNGAAVSATANTELVFNFEKPLTIPGWPAEQTHTDTDGSTYYGSGETRSTGTITGATDGVFKIDFKIKRDGGKNFNFRLMSNAVNGHGYGTVFNGGGSDPAYNYKTFSLDTVFTSVTTDKWSNASLIVDYRGDAKQERDYILTIDDITVVDKMKLREESTMNGFYQIGFNYVYFKDITLNEIVFFGSNGVTATYADASTAVYDSEALSGIGLDKLTFAFNGSFADANNISLVNSKGVAVSGASFAVSGNNVIVTLPEKDLPTDTYKLVVGKNTVCNGKAIGANFEVPVELNTDDLSYVTDDTVTDKINLSIYSCAANKVVFKVNEKTVHTFAAPEADCVYDFLYTPTVVGKNVFDAYVYSDEGVNVLSSSFYYLVDAKMMQNANAVESALTLSGAAKGELITGAGHDGSKAYKISSLEGTPSEPANAYSNSNTTSFSPSNGLFRRMYTEFEIMPGEDTNVATEIGFNLAGVTYGENSSAYRTLNPRGSSPALFNPAGKILGTTTSFVPGTWYKCCQLIDFDKMTCEWWIYTGDNYETLVVSTKDDISNIGSSAASEYPNWKEDIVITYKYKICLHPNNKNSVAATETKPLTPAWIMLDNFKRWHPVETPVVASVTANGAAIKNDVIAKGTDSITVTMDSDFHALPADKIAVTVDGAAVGTVTPIDNKSFTVSGLAGVAEGKKINIKLLKGLSVPYNNNTAAVQADFSFDIFVGDANAICLYPLSVASESGNDLIAFAKYINGSANDLSTYFIMTEYANDDKTLVSQTNFAPITIKAGKVGSVSGYLSDIAKAQGCEVMLWNSNYAPLLESGKVQ